MWSDLCVENQFFLMIGVDPVITSVKISDWRQLQNEAGAILHECGFDAEIERVISTARGSVEVDIYARECIHNREYSIILECKNWKNSIPQNVIHGFRTVISDVGANLGIIITTSKYQAGAFDATSFTNIKLLTWEEFQDEFEEQWIRVFFYPTITKRLDPLFTYTEPILPAWFGSLQVSDKELYFDLRNKYESFGCFMFSLSTWYPEVERPKLPLCIDIIRKFEMENFPQEILKSDGYREFLSACVDYGDDIIKQFRMIRGVPKNKY